MRFELKVPRPPNPRQLVRALAGMGVRMRLVLGEAGSGITTLEVDPSAADKRHRPRIQAVVDENLTLLANYLLTRKFCCVRTCNEAASWVADKSAIEDPKGPLPELVVYSWYYCEKHKPQNGLHLERI